jgi:glycerol kinase
MRKLIIAIDQGTTGSTVLVLDDTLNVLGRANQEFTQYFPKPGWVEHDPTEILASVEQALNRAIDDAGAMPEEIACIGITNQRETVVVWDKATKTAVHRAIVWQDRRTTDICTALKETGVQPMVREKTGLLLDPYFSGTKIKWILDETKTHAAAKQGEVICGTIDSFLVWHLTDGQTHVTDPSNACRTLLMDLKSLQWDDALLDLLDVPRKMLPEIRTSSEIYGYTQNFPGLPDGIPISGMAGDQQSALFGQACFTAGEAKCTYGTGCFVLMNTGDTPVYSEHGLLTSVGWSIGDDVTYVLEGSAFVAGAAVQWLRDGLGIIKSAPEIEALARRVDDSDGVYFVPALTGLGAPHWNPHARGQISGITRGTTAAHLARATLEGIAFQNHEILESMAQDAEIGLAALKVDGGAAANDLLMQIQAELLTSEVVRPKFLETTALGAAFLAGLGAGVWPDQAALTAHWQEDRRFVRTLDVEDIDARKRGWQTAITRL